MGGFFFFLNTSKQIKFTAPRAQGEIARGTSDEELAAAFARYGRVEGAEVIRNKKTGETKGYGFVRFRDVRAVEAAVDDADPPTFLDSLTGKTTHVRVSEADPKSTIYAGRIPKALSEDQVRAAIERICGTRLARFELHLHPDGTSKGYGWARFRSHAQALAGLKMLARTPFPSTPAGCVEIDRPLSVKLAEPRAIDHRVLMSVKALYVKNVNPECPLDELRAFFGGPSCVDRVFLPTLRGTHVPLGTAIVYYRDRASAEEYLRLTDDTVFHGRRIHVEWCLPQEVLRPPKRQQQLQMQMQLQMQLQMQQIQQAAAAQQQQAVAAAAAAAVPSQHPRLARPQDAMAKVPGYRYVSSPFIATPLPPQASAAATASLFGGVQNGAPAVGNSSRAFAQPQHQQAPLAVVVPAQSLLPHHQQQQQQQQRHGMQQQQHPSQQPQQQRQRQLEAAAMAYNQYAAAAAAYGFLPQTDPAAAAAVVAGMQAAAAAAASGPQGMQTSARRGLFRRQQQLPMQPQLYQQ